MLRRFQLSFHAASDGGIFPPEVLVARQQREAESLADWERTAETFAGLADFHAWLHDQHLCYAVRRQVCPINNGLLLVTHQHMGNAEQSESAVHCRRSLVAKRLACLLMLWQRTDRMQTA